MLEYYLEDLFIGHFVELLAALAGTYYLFKTPHPKSIIRLFVYFLWLTVFVEMVGLYAVYAYFTDYKGLEFLRNSPFERNYWLYNSYYLVSFTTYFFFFILHLNSAKIRRILTFTALFFGITVIINLVFSKIFFIGYSAYTSVSGTLILIICIMAYYYEMLKSDKILNFYKNLVFYVSVGGLIWHLVVTPLFIYSKYFTTASPDFVALHGLIIFLSNVFMYGMFILGFIISSKQSKPNGVYLEY
ncbi:hypothetical protein [Gillisia limnaea]|uniref:Membrane protein n=1 Tax=Gillisia limnaea (strain DSM 15749 / LMG 21470 / R-8282) TaxID=865937 RepID=H2BZY4_GILLR|nr:hypothetical protein [Gillisia limnaea]EHQ01326.1 membrane protein [Gillisia limnaea DSM 15749]